MKLDTVDSRSDSNTKTRTISSSLTIELICAPTVSYAAVQNRVPIVQKIRIENHAATDIRNVEVVVTANPTFILGQRFHFDVLMAGEIRTISLNELDLKPDHAYFAALNEAELGHLEVKAIATDGSSTQCINAIEVLAHNEWGGTRGLPELLAAFVQPNSLIVDRLLGAASDLLKRSDSGLSFDGYQSKNRERVWKQVNSIYAVLSHQGLQYGSPPASFESTGQKIRSAERILDARMSTCLDSSILLASCLEQAGLNVVVFFNEGHAWVGVWLIDTCFPTPIIDCVQTVRKRVDSGELLMLEATAITQSSHPSMQWACTVAKAYLDDGTTTFNYGVDIKRARQLHIRALKDTSPTSDYSDNPDDPHSPSVPKLEDMPFMPPLDPSLLPISELEAVDTPFGRLARWKSKLLDLTLRNKLLNFKPGKTFLKIICENPNLLEDELAREGGDFQLKAMPTLMQNGDTRSSEQFFKEEGIAPDLAYAKKSLVNRELVFDVPIKEFDARLTDIFRAGKNTLEETGANTLYVSIGMLYWKESPDAEVVLKAPLILVPVTLKRGAVGAGIRLVRHDDETIVNPTLIQKLAVDFEINLQFVEGQLPTDENGVDVNFILQKVRMAVNELAGFEVRPDCYLGNFSFTKYVMWKDLNSRVEDMSRSKVVNHLINNKGQAFLDDAESVDPKDLDELYAPNQLYTPLISDSSQLAVVCTASNGKNMVVEGPPGTGKSQTITNMIAHYLASGKTVLFVAEKMTALEVVHKRLSSLGLAEFCLELHSSKAKKAEIAKAFVNTLNIAHTRTQSDWENEAEKLSISRNQLTNIVRLLHRSHRNGLTVYQAMGACIANVGTEAALFQWVDADIHDAKEVDTLKNLVADMAALAGQLSSIEYHPLADIGQTKWTPSWQDEILNLCSTMQHSIQRLQQALTDFSVLTDFNPDELSLHELAGLDRLAAALMQARDVPSHSANLAHQQSYRQRLQTLINHGQVRNQLWIPMAMLYVPEVKSLDGKAMRLQWLKASQDWWPKRWFSKRVVTNQILNFSLTASRLPAIHVEPFLESVAALNAEDKFLADHNAFGLDVLGHEYSAESTDWEAAQAQLDWMENYALALNDVYQHRIVELGQLRSHLATLIETHPDMFSAGSPYFVLAVNLRNTFREFSAEWQALKALAIPRAELCGGDRASGILTSVASLAASWQRDKHQLQPWCVWQQHKSHAQALGLQGLVQRVESGGVQLSNLSSYFDFSYKNWWVKRILDKEPLLANFSGATQDHKIAEFKTLDEKFQTITQNYIVAKLRGQIPSELEIKDELSADVAFLRREAQKQRQHKPIRQVIQQSRNLLPRVKPCLLMSPLSVAQYLDAGHAQFDVVIFDEASQIPTWDAVGAIARGKQLVCVGDPKQLPPSNFFSSSDSDGVINEDDVEEMESILDECLSIGMKISTLDWHYRSKSEGLITFSNIQYYENRLITFPSPTTHDQSVRYISVDGIYDAGKSRTNRKEAEAVVDAITEHYLSGRGKELSIGVITFNINQMNLISNLLDAKRVATPALEQAIFESEAEAYLVKNLENVQGDERDIILFSTTFGKDIGGKLSMNFGMINKPGGHRRLNVAASRARHEVRIFSSIRPEDIDLARTSARGVADLKAYLDFALNGARALAIQSLPTGREPDSPFEVAVIQKLRDNGWEVHPQVGVSGYRIDLAVVDPHARGRFLLGIECDGATYHSAASARDRDRLRQMVLEGLGWNIHRIWSTDWWINPEIPMIKLLERLTRLAEESKIGIEQNDTLVN